MGTWSCSTGKGPCWISSASSCSSEGFWFLWRSMIRYWAIDQQMKESVQCNSDPLPRTRRTMENCTEEVSWSKNGGGNLGNLKKICRGAKKSGEWRMENWLTREVSWGRVIKIWAETWTKWPNDYCYLSHSWKPKSPNINKHSACVLCLLF